MNRKSTSTSSPQRFGSWGSSTWDDHYKNTVIPHMRTVGGTSYLEKDIELNFDVYVTTILIPPPPRVLPYPEDTNAAPTEGQIALRAVGVEKSNKIHNEYNVNLSKIRNDHNNMVSKHDQALGAFNACCRLADVADMERLDIRTVFQRLAWVKARYARNDSKGQTRHGWLQRLLSTMKQRPSTERDIRTWYGNVFGFDLRLATPFLLPKGKLQGHARHDPALLHTHKPPPLAPRGFCF
ncbi:hypothetical protein DFJ73DRAFT_331276 [Zopfochytrium polystomum]|nr:hypothetical protein DFJ73DRAFT_331276 [Zopfochytrium polystomum]